MIEYAALGLALIAGFLLGAFFYIGLWWTVTKQLSSQYVGLWFSLSLLVRMAVVAVGFYLVSASHWERAVVCLLGFVIARFLVSRLSNRIQEGSHAS